MSPVQFPDGYRIELLCREHRRSNFDCGVDTVNDWLATNALQNQSKHLSSTKVLVDRSDNITGYYSLAIGQVDFSELPVEFVRKLPRRLLPIVKLAWFGVAKSHQGQRLGSRLLAQALADCYVAGKTFSFIAVILDSLSEEATAFYRKFDFHTLPGQLNRLFLSAEQLEVMMRE